MSKGSAIVLNASINAHLGMSGTTVYGATKAGVVNLAKTLSAELLQKGIRVNAVSPGPITSALLRDGPKERIQETKDWIQSQIPMKRFGTPEEIAAGVLYLTSPESASCWVPNSSLTGVWRRFRRPDDYSAAVQQESWESRAHPSTSCWPPS